MVNARLVLWPHGNRRGFPLDPDRIATPGDEHRTDQFDFRTLVVCHLRQWPLDHFATHCQRNLLPLPPGQHARRVVGVALGHVQRAPVVLGWLDVALADEVVGIAQRIGSAGVRRQWLDVADVLERAQIAE
ncbi:hypothetical protein D3C76_597080 [compost metagenome]